MSLEEIREKIDSIDKEILRLIENRIKLAKETKDFKKNIISFKREEEIYSKLNSNELTKEQIKSIYSEIISASRKAQRELNIAFLGPEGSFSHLASIKKFGTSINFMPQDSFHNVYQALASNSADFGILPLENSIEGSVNSTLDLLQELGPEINIVAEINLKVVHNLIAESSGFDKIYSHPQALAQCRQWLRANYPITTIVETSSTAKAAELAKNEKQAAIASQYAAEKFGLKILQQSIEDNKYNITRFIILGKVQPEYNSNNKTSLLFSVKHKSGALFEALEPFKNNNLNLTKIESRPSKKNPFEYVFFVDFHGHPMMDEAKNAIENMQDKCIFVKILGSYLEDSSK